MSTIGTDVSFDSDWADFGMKVRVSEKYRARNNSENNGNPKYRFNTENILTVFDDSQTQ